MNEARAAPGPLQHDIDGFVGGNPTGVQALMGSD